jgi:hypothetical protein
LDNEYILGITLQHKQHLVIAAVTVLLCTASNLAAPVLSGMLFEHLVQQKPVQEYAQVWGKHVGRPAAAEQFNTPGKNAMCWTCSWPLCPSDAMLGPCPVICPTSLPLPHPATPYSALSRSSASCWLVTCWSRC